MMCKTIHDYDILGNERHEAVSKLRKIPDEVEGYTRSTHAMFFLLLANAIGISEHITFATVRDRLIHLIGGDEEEGDALRDSHDASDCRCDGDVACNCGQARGGEEVDDGLADSVRGSGVCVGGRVDDCGGHSGIVEEDAIAEYHRTLRRMMGEAKCVHDKLVTQAESHAKLKHECRMYRAMLNDAAKEFVREQEINQRYCEVAVEDWKGIAQDVASDASMYLDLLNDAAKEFSWQRTNYEQAMAGYRNCAAALRDSERLRHELEQERYAYKQNYHDIIHGNEINEEWFNKRGFIELPKGADGRHIRIGETVRWGDVGEPFEVQVIYYHPDEVRVSDYDTDVSACQCVHVDEVLDPIASALDKYDAGKLTRDELVAALRGMS